MVIHVITCIWPIYPTKEWAWYICLFTQSMLILWQLVPFDLLHLCKLFDLYFYKTIEQETAEGWWWPKSFFPVQIAKVSATHYNHVDGLWNEVCRTIYLDIDMFQQSGTEVHSLFISAALCAAAIVNLITTLGNDTSACHITWVLHAHHHIASQP